MPYLLADLLSDPSNLDNPCYLEPFPETIEQTEMSDYVIGASNTARWFKRTTDEARAGGDSDVFVLGIKLFADGSVADVSRSKYKYKPLMVSLENLHQSAVNKVIVSSIH